MTKTTILLVCVMSFGIGTELHATEGTEGPTFAPTIDAASSALGVEEGGPSQWCYQDAGCVDNVGNQQRFPANMT
jgi:hypothetical protein